MAKRKRKGSMTRMDLDAVPVSESREEALPRPAPPEKKPGVVCTRCGSDQSRVITTWDGWKSHGMRKRLRRCVRCNKRFTTTEYADHGPKVG